VDGRNAQYVVRFDGWVDHAASRMDITENGKVVEPLVPTLDSEPDVLAASASELAPGRYQLHLACEVDSRRGFLGRVHPLHGRAVMLVEAMTFAQRTGGTSRTAHPCKGRRSGE
jgi:hypothetical protein